MNETLPAMNGKEFVVTSVRYGYNHTIYEADCGLDVTLDDVKERFYDSYFGGHRAWIKDGKCGATAFGCE